MRLSKSSLIILSAFAVFVTCLVIGMVRHITWLIIAGMAVFIAVCVIFGIIRKIALIRELHEALKENDTSAAELMASAIGLGKESRGKFKSAPIRDKLKVAAVFGGFALTMLTFIVGIFFSRLGMTKIGYPIMFSGFGGFLLMIVLLIIIANVNEKLAKKGKRTKRRKPRYGRVRSAKQKEYESEVRATEVLRRGTVIGCKIYEKSKGKLYEVTIKRDNSENTVTAVSFNRYEIGEQVRYFQEVRQPNKCRIDE